MTGMHTITATIAEVMRRYRQLWGAVCWAIALFFVGFGVTYLVLGLKATSVPEAFQALTAYLPGKVHTYGAILLLVGLGLIYGLLNAAHRGEHMRDTYLHHALPYAYGTAAGAAIIWATSWALSGVILWVPVAYWLLVGGLAYALWKLPPYPPDSGRAA